MRLARASDLFADAAAILRPPPRRTPGEWADQNRVLPPTAAEPGPFRCARTPYTIEPMRAMVDPDCAGVVHITPAQSGKTDEILNVIGHRMDDDPTPTLYVAPSKDFVEKEFSPRAVSLLQSTPALWAKVAKGKKQMKTRLFISGTELRMAWAGSAKPLQGFSAGLAAFDEFDQVKNLPGHGNPFAMMRARGRTYPGFRWIVTSTITIGTVLAAVHPDTGLEHWEWTDPKEIESPTWKAWQEGTRHEWAWPCPECGGYWIPRMKHLRWHKGATPDEARRDAWVECPLCQAQIRDAAKPAMLERGCYVSPGQKVDRRGRVTGDGVKASVRSYWVSGLANAWTSFGELAEHWLLAVRSGNPGEVQSCLNLDFAELYSVAGAAPRWEIVAARRLPYRFDELPDGVAIITCGVDVQKLSLPYVVRGWGYRMESWLLRHGEIHGETELDAVWGDLAMLLQSTWGERRVPIRQMLVDSGYRPGDRWRRPEHRVYEFCRRFPGWARPSKGQDALEQPVKLSAIDVTVGNQTLKRAVELVHVNTDWAKSWIHGRLEWPEGEPGGWHIAEDTSDAYCAEITAEARLPTASGRARWVRLRAANHALDCEVGALAGAYLLGVHLLQPGGQAPAHTGRRIRSPGVTV